MTKKKTVLLVGASALVIGLAACGVTVEIPSVSFQLPGVPGAQVQLPTPALKLPDLNTQALMAKIDEARRIGGVTALKAESATLKTMFASATANDFLASVESLPKVASRKTYFNETESKWISSTAFDALPKNTRSNYKSFDHDEDRYYAGHFQSPLAYARALDVANLHGIASLNGVKLLDVSYGAIAASRLMAASGATVVALDGDSSLAALYSQSGDTGSISGVSSRRGALSLVHGAYPSDMSIRSQVGAGYDLIVMVDIPSRILSESKRAKFALDSKTRTMEQLRALSETLKPNGLMVVYRIGVGGTRDAKRSPTSIKSPFTTDELQEAGFKLLAFEQNDDAAVRQMGQLLRWDRALGVSEGDLIASYTVVRR